MCHYVYRPIRERGIFVVCIQKLYGCSVWFQPYKISTDRQKRYVLWDNYPSTEKHQSCIWSMDTAKYCYRGKAERFRESYGDSATWQNLTMGVVYLGGSQRIRTVSRTPGVDYIHVEILGGIPHVFNGLPWVCGQCYANSLPVGVKTFAPYPYGWSVRRCTYRGRLCEKCILRDRAEVGK